MSLTEAEALATGSLAAMLMQYAEDPQRSFLVDKVDLEVDPAGNYKSAITLTLRSGTVLRVIVAEVVSP